MLEKFSIMWNSTNTKKPKLKNLKKQSYTIPFSCQRSKFILIFIIKLDSSENLKICLFRQLLGRQIDRKYQVAFSLAGGLWHLGPHARSRRLFGKRFKRWNILRKEESSIQSGVIISSDLLCTSKFIRSAQSL